MPGVLLKYLVKEGQPVSKGDPIAVLEAMKMENTLPSPSDGVVASTPINAGDTVVKGDILVIIS
jgi:biotin carboxyl carrier protein